jgi:hypothetical protein
MDINQLNEEDIDKYFKAKYIKYKSKYLALKQQKGAGLFDIGKAWNTSVQFVQENVIEKPVNYVTSVTQQLTPQELTLEQKKEDELNQDIAALQQQLIEQKKIVQNTRRGTKEYKDAMYNQMIIDQKLLPKIKELQTIKKKQEDFKRNEAEKLRRYEAEEERKKKWEEQQIEAKRIRNNDNIIDLLHRLITIDTKIFTDYIVPINAGKCKDKGMHLLNIYTNNNYSLGNFNKLIDIKADLFNNETQRSELIKKIIRYIFTKSVYKIINQSTKNREDLNETNIQGLIDYLNTIIEEYIRNPNEFFRNQNYLYLYHNSNVCHDNFAKK